MNKTFFLSHRGESDDAPENTLAAFALAMERDSDGIELDIRMTSDKQIVCVHDATLERVAEKNLAVAEHTWQELCEVHPVPLISEALDVLLPGRIGWFPPASETKYLPSGKITIPKAFYKVIYDLTPPVKMIGFIIPHRSSDQPLQVFAVSVDEVEKQTGLDFFSKLPDDLEERLEVISY